MTSAARIALALSFGLSSGCAGGAGAVIPSGGDEAAAAARPPAPSESAQGTAASASRAPVLDMHLHAFGANDNGPAPVAMCPGFMGTLPQPEPNRSWDDLFLALLKAPPCANPVWGPTTDDGVRAETVAALERRNGYGVLSGAPERVKQWSESAPGRFIAARPFRLDPRAPSIEELRRAFKAGEFAVLAEVLNQYAGVLPDDPRMEPYWALAEELDIPVGVHMGQGPPGATHLGMSDYRVAAGRPLLLENVLVKHPRLRLYVMHFGAPFVDEMIALMTAHPQLYVDLGGNQWMFPRPHFYRQLQKFVDAGFARRVMFGSDQMNWPGLIERAIDIVEEAPFLTDEQRRDILYNNGARFLRLSPEEIARHARG